MEWHSAIEKIEPYVVRIATPSGSGTGFLVSHSTTTSVCAVATAAHVVDHAHYWEQPIRIEHTSSGKSLLFRNHERAVVVDAEKDIAGLVIDKRDLPLPDKPFDITPEGKTLKNGVEIGWLGYPALPWQRLCFFSGRASTFVSLLDAYLVDGVAINGVSGGPAFVVLGDKITLIGIVSAYIANRATGETLPGVSLVRNIAPFRDYIKRFASVDEAKKKEPPAAPPPATSTSGPRGS